MKKWPTCAKEDESDSCLGKIRRSKRANSSTRAAFTDDDEAREESGGSDLTRHAIWAVSASAAGAAAMAMAPYDDSL